VETRDSQGSSRGSIEDISAVDETPTSAKQRKEGSVAGIFGSKAAKRESKDVFEAGERAPGRPGGTKRELSSLEGKREEKKPRVNPLTANQP
jgi:hypothetical protein